MKAKWSVLAVYENAGARESAMRFCDCLVDRFWSEHGLDLGWCEWQDLEAPGSSAEKRAREADLIIVAPGGERAMPPSVKAWLEVALKQRRDREGVLVGLPAIETEHSAVGGSTQMYLRTLAHQAGMDYLTAVPDSLPADVPESADAYTLRATQVTSVLDDILRNIPLPPQTP